MIAIWVNKTFSCKSDLYWISIFRKVYFHFIIRFNPIHRIIIWPYLSLLVTMKNNSNDTIKRYESEFIPKFIWKTNSAAYYLLIFDVSKRQCWEIFHHIFISISLDTFHFILCNVTLNRKSLLEGQTEFIWSKRKVS